METRHTHPRGAAVLLVGSVLVWSVASLASPGIGRSSGSDPVDARMGPLTVLAAIASDGPTTKIAARTIEHLDALPGLISADAVTRSALLSVIGDMRFPASLIATSRLAIDLIRRGPPLSFAP